MECMETKDLIANLREWHENLISELCADDVLTCDDLCGYPGTCIVIQAANLLEAQQKRIAELEAALREQEERRWIPVKERLPEHGDVVLCFMKFWEHRILQWDNVSSLWLGYGHGDDWQKADVTNWMPLPEPPKEDNCEILQRLCWL